MSRAKQGRHGVEAYQVKQTKEWTLLFGEISGKRSERKTNVILEDVSIQKNEAGLAKCREHNWNTLRWASLFGKPIEKLPKTNGLRAFHLTLDPHLGVLFPKKDLDGKKLPDPEDLKIKYAKLGRKEIVAYAVDLTQ